MTKLTQEQKTQAISIDNRLLNTRYRLEVEAIKASSKSEYEKRYLLSQVDNKYYIVREALVGLYDLGIQHCCNLSELLGNYNF